MEEEITSKSSVRKCIMIVLTVMLYVISLGTVCFIEYYIVKTWGDLNVLLVMFLIGFGMMVLYGISFKIYMDFSRYFCRMRFNSTVIQPEETREDIIKKCFEVDNKDVEVGRI